MIGHIIPNPLNFRKRIIINLKKELILNITMTLKKCKSLILLEMLKI